MYSYESEDLPTPFLQHILQMGFSGPIITPYKKTVLFSCKEVEFIKPQEYTFQVDLSKINWKYYFYYHRGDLTKIHLTSEPFYAKDKDFILVNYKNEGIKKKLSDLYPDECFFFRFDVDFCETGEEGCYYFMNQYFNMVPKTQKTNWLFEGGEPTQPNTKLFPKID